MIDHFLLESNQGLFHVEFGSPVGENTEFVDLNLACCLVHAGHVDLGGEIHFRGLGGIVRAALDCQEVYAVVIVGVGRSDNSATPLSECAVVTYLC